MPGTVRDRERIGAGGGPCLALLRIAWETARLAFVPERSPLVSQESRDAAYRLLDEIRHAESSRELLVYMRHFHMGASEFRDLINMIETAVTAKIEEFAREIDETVEPPRIVPAPDKKSGGRRGG